MKDARAIAQALRRLEHLEKIRAALEECCEFVDDPTFTVRRQRVVLFVAARIKETVNNVLYRDVLSEARAIGWALIRNGNRRLFGRVKIRGMKKTEALEMSRANRRKQSRRRQT